jgi:hypothetical protein
MSQKSTEVATKNVAYCVQKIFCEHSYLQYSSATHVRNRAVSGLVISGVDKGGVQGVRTPPRAHPYTFTTE